MKMVGQRAAARVLGVKDRSDGSQEALSMIQDGLAVPVHEEAAVGRIPGTSPCPKKSCLLHERAYI